MKIELVPLLQLQRNLYTTPRGQERFRTYFETIINTDGSALELPPLAVMNPMGKDHILTRQLLFLHILELRHDYVGCC